MVSSSTTMKVLTVVINIVLAVSVTAVVLDVSRQDLGGHDHEQAEEDFFSTSHEGMSELENMERVKRDEQGAPPRRRDRFYAAKSGYASDH
ncbi:hypothetical protein ACHWQZ_G003353 [Mnemiopsis leidyi]